MTSSSDFGECTYSPPHCYYELLLKLLVTNDDKLRKHLEKPAMKNETASKSEWPDRGYW